MPKTRQIGATFWPVITWTRRSSGVFFYLVPGGLENLDLHGLLAERALELTNALFGGPQRAGRHHLFVRAHRGRAPTGAQVLPAADHGRRHGQFPRQLRQRHLTPLDPPDLFQLEGRAEDPPTIGPTTMSFHLLPLL
ncbi:MAG: hypothetical protein NTW72_03865 [Gemmatimonadetes bacterium]|nr:hypothetical protein [Gemmatimonadota bacterium]